MARIWKKKAARLKFEIPSVILGAGIPIAVLFFYNVTVFDSLFKSGYDYTQYPVKFAYQYLGATDPTGQSIPFKIILGNFRNAPWPLFVGYPLLVIGIPGFFIIFYQKIAAFFKRHNPSRTWANLNTELPWDILLVLTGWFISVFGLFMMYEWTSTATMGSLSHIQMREMSFIVISRFYLPGLFPIAVIASLIVARFPFRLWAALMVIAVIAGSTLYVNSALSETLIPLITKYPTPPFMPPRFSPP